MELLMVMVMIGILGAISIVAMVGVGRGSSIRAAETVFHSSISWGVYS